MDSGADTLDQKLVPLYAVGQQKLIVTDAKPVPLRLLKEQRLNHPNLIDLGVSHFHVSAPVYEKALLKGRLGVQGAAAGRFVIKLVFSPRPLVQFFKLLEF